MSAPTSVALDVARALDPSILLEESGITPQPWQRKVLRNWRLDHLLLCSRHAGKTTVGGALAAFLAKEFDESLVVVASAANRQSGELFRKSRMMLRKVPDAPTFIRDADNNLELANNSRIVAVPGSEETIRGLSGATALLIDEAALVEPEILIALEPMLSTTNGPRWALTSARAKSGWFYNEWNGDDPDFHRVMITADQCPHISKAYLEKKRRQWPESKFQREFFCQFEDPDELVIASDLIRNAVNPEERALCI